MPGLAEFWSILDQPIRILLLLVAVNSAPILVRWVFGRKLAWPLDGNLPFIDGRPLFGRAKTIRGVVAGCAAGVLCAPLLGLPIKLGIAVAALSLAGDLLSSFIKRRLALTSGSRAPLLDQLPEALLPLLVLREALTIGWPTIGGVTLAFVVIDIVLSRPLHRLGLRDKPH